MGKEKKDEVYESSYNNSVDDVAGQKSKSDNSRENIVDVDVVDNPSSIDALLYDTDEDLYTAESYEETAHFNDFLMEYNKLFDQAKKASEYSFTEFPEQFSIFPEIDNEKNNKNKEKNRTASFNENWHDEITLVPETYADPDEDDNIFRDIPLGEEDAGDDNRENEDEDSITYIFDESARPESSDEETTERKYDPDNPRLIDSIFDFVELFVLTLVAVMILTTFLFKHSVVEGSSMYSTLEDGDHLIITDTFYTPKRGDIVVFEDYSTYLKKAVVKRVIGLPGETVEVSIGADGVYVVRVNGEILEEDYDYTDRSLSPPPIGKWEIGEGEVFVMGDNRYNSTDSRDIGPIDIDTILGKVILRFYPLNKFGGVD